jgi:hypothetical protein
VADEARGLDEVNEEFKLGKHVRGVPHFIVDGAYQVSCSRPVVVRALGLLRGR